MTSSDPNRLIASLARDQVNLDLKTVDLCFLAGLYLRADRAALASFEKDLLVDMFEQICDVVDPGAENPRKRATHAIQRLREQRMLARVDGAGLVRAGEYALTRLAATVVEYFLADDALTCESLTLLTGTLRAKLAEVLAAAKRAGTAEAWRQDVVGPLRVTVGDLVQGIERHQRGLDAQQEEVQTEIAKLLQADCFSAVERCQSLLDTTTNTLRELNEVLHAAARELLAAGGPFDPELVTLRDQLGADLFAANFEDAGLEKAGVLEARLGPLAQALVVDNLTSAARAIAARPRSLGSVWLLSREQNASAIDPTLEHQSGSPDVFVEEGRALRVSRIPEQPRLGRKARERRAAELREEGLAHEKDLDHGRTRGAPVLTISNASRFHHRAAEARAITLAVTMAPQTFVPA